MGGSVVAVDEAQATFFRRHGLTIQNTPRFTSHDLANAEIVRQYLEQKERVWLLHFVKTSKTEVLQTPSAIEVNLGHGIE